MMNIFLYKSMSPFTFVAEIQFNPTGISEFVVNLTIMFSNSQLPAALN